MNKGEQGNFERKEANMSTADKTDRRRHGVIEVSYRPIGKLAMYNLTMNGRLWACVEWSPSRKGWCIQDGSGHCLAHCDAIHGQDIDAQTAIKLAKKMIRDGTLPCPEEAHQQLEERLQRDRLDEPMQPLGEPLELWAPMQPIADMVSIPRGKGPPEPIVGIEDAPPRRRRDQKRP